MSSKAQADNANNNNSVKAPSILPYPRDKLTTPHMKELIRIRAALLTWLLVDADVDETDPKTIDAVDKAMEDLMNFRVNAPYAFTPSSPHPYRAVILSCTKCYWMALIDVLDDAEKEELIARLNSMPTFEDKIPKFDGERCVRNPAELNEIEYGGLMRIATFVIVDLTSDDVLKVWRELAEVGVQTWED